MAYSYSHTLPSYIQRDLTALSSFAHARAAVPLLTSHPLHRLTTLADLILLSHIIRCLQRGPVWSFLWLRPPQECSVCRSIAHTAADRRRDEFWSVFGPCLVRDWSVFGPWLVRVWPVYDLCLVHTWLWSVSRPVFASGFGPYLVHVCLAVRRGLARVLVCVRSTFGPCGLHYGCLARVWSVMVS